MLKVKSITATNCRGLVDGPELAIGAGGMLLCGANATGKSSYIDAIERVVTGSCSSLDTGDMGLSWAKHGAHVSGKGPAEVALTLGDGGKDTVLTLDTDKGQLSKDVRKWLEEGCKGSFVLRRRTMLRFIEAKPSERYRSIESFLNLRAYTGWEELLKVAVSKLAKELAEASERIRRSETILRGRYSLSLMQQVTREACLASLTATTRKAGLAAVSSDDDVGEVGKRAADQLSSFGDSSRLQLVYALQEACKTVPDGNELVMKAREYADAAAAWGRAATALKGHFYPAVLEHAIAWWEEDGLDACPVCEHEADRVAVKARVSERMAESAGYVGAQQEEVARRAAFLKEVRACRGAAKEAVRAWGRAFGSQSTGALASVIDALGTFEEVLTDAVDGVIAADLAKRASSLGIAEAMATFAANAKAAAKDVPETERYEALASAKLGCDAFVSTFPVLETDRKQAATLEYQAAQFAIVRELAEQARKDTVQALIDRVSTVADGYYQKIHPGESIGAPKLKVTDRGTASIQLESDFYGKRADPRARYSEGHVDSLGLCLFLAIRRLHHTQENDFALLVLDDVLHSVDGSHRRETAQLIFDEFQDHQIVVTTHDPIWFENLKTASRTVGRKFTKYYLADWTLEGGPVLGDHLSDYEWLVSTQAVVAKPADKVIKAGRLLEEVLHNACHSLKASVEYNIEGAYTVEPLWQAFKRRSGENKGFDAAAGVAVKRIDTIREVRNWVGAHWNAWALQLTPKEANDFVDAVIGLREALYCSDCERFVERIAQLNGVWSCQKEHKRYDAKAKAST